MLLNNVMAISSQILVFSLIGILVLILVLIIVSLVNRHKKKVNNNDVYMKGIILGRADMIRREIVKVIDSNDGVDPKIIKCFKDAEQQMVSLKQNSDIATYRSVEDHMLTILTMFRCIVANVNPSFDIDYKEDNGEIRTHDWLDISAHKKTTNNRTSSVNIDRGFIDDGGADDAHEENDEPVRKLDL